MSNNSVNSDAQLRCAPLGASYAGRSVGHASRVPRNVALTSFATCSYGAKRASGTSCFTEMSGSSQAAPATIQPFGERHISLGETT